MKISDKYTIRIADKDDIPEIMSFIDKWWKKNHIIAIDREYFEYEFLEDDESVNFIIAVDNDTATIEGLEGYLKTARKGVFDVWTSFWKVTDTALPLLGVEIRKKIDELSGCRYSYGIGDNPKTTVPLMKRVFKRNCYKMQQYYMLGQCDDYKVAVVGREQTNLPQKKDNLDVFEVETIESFLDIWSEIEDSKWIPRKDSEYYIHRFYENPINQYRIFGIQKDDKPISFFIVREQRHMDKIVLRIVDYYGDDCGLYAMGWFIKSWLIDEKLEYADFYCFGYDEQKLKQSGFDVIEESDANVIPNYFYPFVQENIDIWLDSPVEGAKFCKGDSDQDRPSVRE